MSRASYKANREASRLYLEQLAALRMSTPIPPTHPSQMSEEEARREARSKRSRLALLAMVYGLGGGIEGFDEMMRSKR